MAAVSVIIPTHNHSGFLREAVVSVLNQTCKPAEILLVDDGSIAEHKSAIDHVCQEDPIIRCIRLERQQGVSHARNVGIKMASGDFILFLDDDDKLAPQMIEKSLQMLQLNPEAGVVISKGEVLKGDATTGYYQSRKAIFNLHQQRYGNLSPSDERFFLVYSPIIHSMFFRREVLEDAQFPEDLRYGEDRFLWMELRKLGVRFAGTDHTAGFYRVSSRVGKVQDQARFFEKLLKSGLATSQFEIGYVRSFLFLLSIRAGDWGGMLRYGLKVMLTPGILLRIVWKFFRVRF